MKTHLCGSPCAAAVAVAAALYVFASAPSVLAGGPGGGVGGVSAGGGVGISAGGGRSGAVSAVSATHGGVSFSNSGARSSGSLAAPYHNTLNTSSGSAVMRVPASAGARNGWSGAAQATGVGGQRYAARTLYHSNGVTNNRFSGTYLNPSAFGANLPATAGNSWTQRGGRDGAGRNGQGNGRGIGRYRYNPYGYGPGYAPYVGLIGGDYGGFYDGAYPYSSELPDSNANLVATAPGSTASGTIVPSADQYTDQPAQQQNPQPGPAANPGSVADNGPDSLVEAVQEELSRRGYFGGRVDAMFNADTKAALRKFQTDHHLAETGLINEATLHALQLD